MSDVVKANFIANNAKTVISDGSTDQIVPYGDSDGWQDVGPYWVLGLDVQAGASGITVSVDGRTHEGGTAHPIIEDVSVTGSEFVTGAEPGDEADIRLIYQVRVTFTGTSGESSLFSLVCK